MDSPRYRDAPNRPAASWLKDAIIYNILIDRFARGNNEAWIDADGMKPIFCGGNLQGVIDRLDYLQHLGVNTLLLTPFHPTPAYHGYHVLDFYGVDPRFGTRETVKELLHAAHQRKIHVVMDFVLNHVSDKHPFFLDAQTNPQSHYRTWFHFNAWPHNYVSFLNYYELPKLNLANTEVKEHIIQAALYWTDLGFDGLRLDHVVGVPHGFLRELRIAVKRRHPACVLIGETAVGRMSIGDLKTLRIRHKLGLFVLSQLRVNTNFFLQRQYAKELDGVFDFFFRDLAEGFIIKKSWTKPPWLLRIILHLHYAGYPQAFSLISLLDNLDLDRFSFQVGDKAASLKQALELQFAQAQPVIVLYGNEVGIEQRETRSAKDGQTKPNGDVVIRAPMPWNKTDQDLFDFYKQLIGQRKKRTST